MDVPDCQEDEEICGAHKCMFTRFIYDGCGQISNRVYEEIRILPRRPYFRSFPGNFPVECNENMNVTQNMDRFVLPVDFHTGCRGVDVSLAYEDELVRGSACAHTIYRSWRVQVEGCEPTLFSTKTQRIFVEDNQAPRFLQFPADRSVQFFDPFGPDVAGTPSVVDGCGHGPSKLVYSDKFVANLIISYVLP